MQKPQYVQDINGFIFQSVNRLISELTPFQPTDKNFSILTTFIFKNIKDHKFTSLSPYRVKAETTGIIEKFRQFSKIEIANRLLLLWNKFMSIQLKNPYEIDDINFSCIQLLLSLAESPLNTTYDPVLFARQQAHPIQENPFNLLIEELQPTEEELDQWKGTDSENESEIIDDESKISETKSPMIIESKKPIQSSPKFKDESTNFCCTDDKSNILNILGVYKDPPVQRTVPVISCSLSHNLLDTPLSEVPHYLYSSYLKELCEKKELIYLPKVVTENELIISILLMFQGMPSSLITFDENGFELKIKVEVLLFKQLSHLSYSCVKRYMAELMHYANLIVLCESNMKLMSISSVDIFVYYCKKLISEVRTYASQLQLILLYQCGHITNAPDMSELSDYKANTMTLLSILMMKI